VVAQEPGDDPPATGDRLYTVARTVTSVDECLFYHSVDLPETGSIVGLWDLRPGIEQYLGHVDFTGKRVLEIGPASGYVTSEMERRGADVVGVELPDGWAHDFVPMAGVDLEAIYAQSDANLERIKNSFWLVHRELGLRARVYTGLVTALPAEFGTFDVTMAGSVLLHTRDPIGILLSCAARTTETIVVTDVCSFEGGIDRCGAPVSVLYPTLDNGIVDRWWTFSPEYFEVLLRALGFVNTRTELHEQHAVYADVIHPMFTVVASRMPLGERDPATAPEAARLVARLRSSAGSGAQPTPDGAENRGAAAPEGSAPETAAAAKRAVVDSMPRWFHSIDIGDGVVTPGVKSMEWLATEFAALELPPLEGASVLDIGAWDGFFSFEAERRGASRVVALDWFVWAIRWAETSAYIARCQAEGVAPRPFMEMPELWSPALPGKRGFDLVRSSLGSQVEPIVGDFMTIDVDAVGRFDVVLFLGVIYHQRHPLLALERLREFTTGLAVIESYARFYPGMEHLALWEFFEDELEGDHTNWWAPNLTGLLKLCRSAGFRSVEVVSGPPDVLLDLPANAPPVPYRAILHARP
jgi:2-polyprenyl-3-methyl-5-hydroxy-6-metoxy-1,4-benzoquinol methylase